MSRGGTNRTSATGSQARHDPTSLHPVVMLPQYRPAVRQEPGPGVTDPDNLLLHTPGWPRYLYRITRQEPRSRTGFLLSPGQADCRLPRSCYHPSGPAELNRVSPGSGPGRLPSSSIPVEMAGIGPATARLRGAPGTSPVIPSKWSLRDSDPRPSACHADALPSCAKAPCVRGTKGTPARGTSRQAWWPAV